MVSLGNYLCRNWRKGCKQRGNKRGIEHETQFFGELSGLVIEVLNQKFGKN
jgi:hypothetical protein